MLKNQGDSHSCLSAPFAAQARQSGCNRAILRVAARFAFFSILLGRKDAV
jgi:hypothetical protein